MRQVFAFAQLGKTLDLSMGPGHSEREVIFQHVVVVATRFLSKITKYFNSVCLSLSGPQTS